MVPHSLSIAKRKLIHFSKLADILSRDRQFLGKLARLSRIRHFSLDASQKHLLHCDGASIWTPTAAISLLQYKHLPTTTERLPTMSCPQAAAPAVPELRYQQMRVQ